MAVGTSRLIEREALASFLERVQEADDVPAVLDQVRQQKTAASRRRLRTLVQKDDEVVARASLPAALTLSRGRVEVNFRTLEELTEAMYFLARALDGDLEGFAERYEPLPKRAEESSDEGVEMLFRELEAAEHAAAVR